MKLQRLALTLFLTALAVPASAQTTEAKLDESLCESVERGCVGSQSVIIRTKPGYRQGLRDALTAHGDVVTGEFPALDAVAAEVYCDDLVTLASFISTSSVSVNAPVGSQQTAPVLISQAQANLDAARAAVLAARAAAAAADVVERNAESALTQARKLLATAQKAVTAAQKAITAANRLTGSAKTNALASANAQLVAANAQVAAAQAQVNAAASALASASAASRAADAAVFAAQRRAVEAQQALASAIAAREREGQAAKGLKRKHFATLAATNLRTAVRSARLTTGVLTNDTSSASLINATLGTVSVGSGVVGVAVVDSGIEPGTDFDNRISAFYDFTQGDIRAVAPNDGYGHGTHVAGLIASEFVGVAPNARLIGLKVLDSNGQGTTDNVVRAIEFAIANKALLGISILNLSLGHPIFEPAATDPLVQAVEHATRAGISVVVSAGNCGMNPKTGEPGYAGIASPGNAPSALTVGAARTFDTTTREDDRIAPYSSRGPSWYDGFAKPNFVTPGDNLLSIAVAGSKLRLAQEARGNTGDYMRLSGTSMAAGVASGVAALVLQANGNLTPNAVKAILEFSAIPVKNDDGKPYDPLTQGTGDIEAAGAVALALSINTSAPIGSSWQSTSVAPSTLIGRQVYAWSQSVIWGNRRVVGKHLLSEQRPGWALNIVWGEGLGDEDDNIVWGNSAQLGNVMQWSGGVVAGKATNARARRTRAWVEGVQ